MRFLKYPFSTVGTDLNARASQIHVGFPLSFHLAVLRGLGMDELFAVRRVQLPRDCALKGLRCAGAIQGVRPVGIGHVPGKNTRKTEDFSENSQETH